MFPASKSAAVYCGNAHTPWGAPIGTLTPASALLRRSFLYKLGRESTLTAVLTIATGARLESEKSQAESQNKTDIKEKSKANR